MPSNSVQQIAQDLFSQDHHCNECGADCAEWESPKDFEQWKQNDLCCDCNDRGYREFVAEVNGSFFL